MGHGLQRHCDGGLSFHVGPLHRCDVHRHVALACRWAGRFRFAGDSFLFTGYEGIFCGFSAIYAGLAQVLNELYGRVILPLGPVMK
jgi:hypothetical protein